MHIFWRNKLGSGNCIAKSMSTKPITETSLSQKYSFRFPLQIQWFTSRVQAFTPTLARKPEACYFLWHLFCALYYERIPLFIRFSWISVFFSDLLYRDYQADRKFTLSTLTSNGVVSILSFPPFWFVYGAEICISIESNNVSYVWFE